MRIFVAALMSLCVTSVAHAQSWRAGNSSAGEGACSSTGDLTLCLSFKSDGVWFTLTNAGFDNFGEDFPALRVDSGETAEVAPQVVRELEAATRERMIPRSSRAKEQTWRGLVPSPTGEWTDKPAPLILDMIKGSKLNVRVRYENKKHVDVAFSLKGFCAAAAKVYAREAPPLKCGS